MSNPGASLWGFIHGIDVRISMIPNATKREKLNGQKTVRHNSVSWEEWEQKMRESLWGESSCSVEQPQGKFQNAWRGEPPRPGYILWHTNIQDVRWFKPWTIHPHPWIHICLPLSAKTCIQYSLHCLALLHKHIKIYMCVFYMLKMEGLLQLSNRARWSQFKCLWPDY